MKKKLEKIHIIYFIGTGDPVSVKEWKSGLAGGPGRTHSFLVSKTST